MEKVIVNLGERSYPICIGFGLLKSFFSILQWKKEDLPCLVTDDRIAPIYLDFFLKSSKDYGIFLDYIILPCGEIYKSLSMLEYIITKLLEKGYHRNNLVLIALGGGVIGDLVGFAAAVYQRGVRFIQVPTTLLSQVDAAIGGKTGVNHSLGKNMIGVLYQPVFVVVELEFLYTLSKREFSCGLAEVIKYGIAFDSAFFEWLEFHIEDILNLDPLMVPYCVRRCCELKGKVVENDEYDLGQGVRSLLNLGHTYGHAIESYFKYGQEWLHGEAVSVGLMMAVNLSRIFGYLKDFEVQRVRSLLLRAHLPVDPPIQMGVEDYLFFINRDKKNISDQLCLVLPVAIGKSKICTNVENSLIISSIQDFKRRL